MFPDLVLLVPPLLLHDEAGQATLQGVERGRGGVAGEGESHSGDDFPLTSPGGLEKSLISMAKTAAPTLLLYGTKNYSSRFAKF